MENDDRNNMTDRKYDNTDNERAIDLTRGWVEQVVIKHNFCPFAAKPFRENKIRYAVSNAENEKDLVDCLVDELAKLRDTDKSQIETSILILTSCLADFENYNQFLDIVDAILEEMDLEGEIQVATFHPDYCFADLSADDVRNYTNRSIYPMFHLIREESVEAARDFYPDVEQIPDNNMKHLEDMGLPVVLKQISDIKRLN